MALTVPDVKNAKPKEKDYKLAAEKGLFLLVKKNGSKYWRMKYRFAGKEKLLALGVFPEVTLAKARIKRDKARSILQDGIDPSQARQLNKQAQKDASSNSFKSVALDWMDKRGKKSESGDKRLLRILENDLFPTIGHLPVSEITPPQLLVAIRKIEDRGAIKLSRRALQYAKAIFGFAIASGRATNNPSSDLLGSLASVPETVHLSAIIDPKDVGRLMAAIDNYEGTVTVSAALKLSPLLFCRPGELRHMEWTEINWEESRWEIPAGKMKMQKPHIVPLSKQSLGILEDLKCHPIRGRYVFPSARGASRPLSENGVRTALRTMGYDNKTMTPHGFRAMARTILDEVLGFRVEWIEHQLAHAVRDANGRAYNRTSHIKDRTTMMQKWADYLNGLKAEALNGNVIAGKFGGNQ